MVFLALLCVHAEAVKADETLWDLGLNLYIKLVGQDTSGGAPPNQHPVSLDAKEITNALTSIELWDRHLFKKDELNTAFSSEQARLLGLYLSSGLRKARPDQDIIFALIRREKKYVVIENKAYTAGRAFYANGRLNIILGDFERPPDGFKERAYQSSGISEIQYSFSHGKRSKPSDFDKQVIASPGIQNYQNGSERRKDWLVIDVTTASNAYLAKYEQNREPDASEVNQAMQMEAAKLAQERREMRLEMARLRKEMADGGGRTTDKNSGDLSMEERFKLLEDLKSQGLITEEEYQSKRKEILNDI